MARTKAGKEPGQLRKTGHNLTYSAVELLRSLSDLLRADEAIIIETGIKQIYDKLPAGQKEAVATILRAKGGNLREVRKINSPSVEAGEGQGGSVELNIVKANDTANRIADIARSSTAPVDDAIDSLTGYRTR